MSIKTDIINTDFYNTLTKEKLEEIITTLSIAPENDRELIAYVSDGKGGFCRLEESPIFDEYLKKELEIK